MPLPQHLSKARLCVCVCVCQNRANAQSTRGGILYGPDGQLILSLLEREGGGNKGQQHAEALTLLITHTDKLRSLKGATFVSLSLYDTVCLVMLDTLMGRNFLKRTKLPIKRV